MKDCFLKLHKVDKSTMDKIVSVALAEHDWHSFADTYSSFDENGVRKSPRYVSTISQGIFDTWNENMQFISDLILPKALEPYAAVHALNKIPPDHAIDAHHDHYRECCVYLPIYPVREKYMPFEYFIDNQDYCIDNYDIGQVYLCNLKILHRVQNSTELPRFNYQITLNRPYKEICKLIAS